MYLRLHVFKKELPPSPGPFFAAYEFDVPQAGRYRIWMRGSQQDSGGLEPFWVSVDGKAFVNLKGKAWMGSGEGIDQPWTYLGWFEAGRAELSAGRHRMRVEIRSARPQDELYAGFIDAILLTTDGQFVPTGTHVKYSPYPAWAEQMKARTYKEYHHEVERKWYRKRIALCEAEEANAKASEEVRRKLSGRTLPAADETKGRDRRFGLQGMVWSFIEAGKDEPKVRGVYDLLARAGVASFRTTDSLWFRVGEKADDFKELDFQIASAARYGQTFMFMIGFPPAGFGQGKGTFTAVRPEHDKAYRTYLRTLFERYRDKGVVKFAELGNEVDAPEVWWTDSTPDLYVREMKIVCDEVRKADPRVKLLAFGATYSRDE